MFSTIHLASHNSATVTYRDVSGSSAFQLLTPVVGGSSHQILSSEVLTLDENKAI